MTVGEQELLVTADPKTATSTARFWVVSSRHLQSSLVVSCSAQALPQAEQKIKFSLTDCDGAVISNVGVGFPAGQVGVFEIDPFMQECKLESGIRYARLETEIPAGARALLRYHTAHEAFLVESAAVVAADHSVFYPLVLGAGREMSLVMMNCADEPAEIRCRAFAGKRSPEFAWNIPANGNRIVSLTAECQGLVEADETTLTRGYVRLTSRSLTGVAVHLVESQQGAKGGEIFSIVS